MYGQNSGYGAAGGQAPHPGQPPYPGAPGSAPYPPYPGHQGNVPYPGHLGPPHPAPRRGPEAPFVRRPYGGTGFGWWLGWLLPPVAAHRLCRPSRHGRVEDPTTRTVQRMRAFAGVVVLAGVAAAYNLSSVAEEMLQPWMIILQNCGMLLVLVPLVTTVFVRCARPHLRRGYVRRTRGPAAALGALFVGAGVLTAILVLQTQGVVGKTTGMTLAACWFLMFAVTALVNAVGNVFRTADVHDVLPPLVTMVLVWSNMLVDQATGKYAEAPESVLTLLLYGGPVTVTLLALWELRRLRTRHGLTLRGALGR